MGLNGIQFCGFSCHHRQLVPHDVQSDESPRGDAATPRPAGRREAQTAGGHQLVLQDAVRLKLLEDTSSSCRTPSCGGSCVFLQIFQRRPSGPLLCCEAPEQLLKKVMDTVKSLVI